VTDAAGAPVPIWPIALMVPWSVNQMLPSGPAAIPPGLLPAFRPVLNSVIAWVVGLICPDRRVVPLSVNQRLPSGPSRDPARVATRVQADAELGDRSWSA
jgi:hypothetical protein